MKSSYGVLLIAVVGCSDQGVSGRGAAGAGSAGESGGGAAGEAGNSGGGASNKTVGLAGASGDAGAGGANDVFQPFAIWNEGSATVRVKSGDFFDGYFEYERTRAQLSAAQLAALEQIRTAPELDACLADGLDVRLTITDQGGESARYFNNSCSAAQQNFDFAQAQPFLDTVPRCLLSKDERSTALATAPTVAIGDGCLNGLFISSAQPTQHPTPPTQRFVRVAVPTANVPVQLDLSECGQHTFLLELLDPAGATVLATGAASATSCQALSYSFAAAGTYVVRVTVGEPGGVKFWLRAN